MVVARSATARRTGVRFPPAPLLTWARMPRSDGVLGEVSPAPGLAPGRRARGESTGERRSAGCHPPGAGVPGGAMVLGTAPGGMVSPVGRGRGPVHVVARAPRPITSRTAATTHTTRTTRTVVRAGGVTLPRAQIGRAHV